MPTRVNMIPLKIETLKTYAGGDSAYERGGDARREFWIKPLKETDLGVAQGFFNPKRDLVETQSIYIFSYFSRATLNEIFTAKYDGVLPRTP